MHNELVKSDSNIHIRKLVMEIWVEIKSHVRRNCEGCDTTCVNFDHDCLFVLSDYHLYYKGSAKIFFDKYFEISFWKLISDGKVERLLGNICNTRHKKRVMRENLFNTLLTVLPNTTYNNCYLTAECFQHSFYGHL